MQTLENKELNNLSSNTLELNDKTKWHALLAAWLGESFDAMDAMMYFIILYPCLADLLHTSDATSIGWHGALIMSIFTLGWGLGSILFGFMSDRIGRIKK